jgi:hypothetical protein
VVTIILSTTSMAIVPTSNNAMAQFMQPIRVNIDKSTMFLDEFGLVIMNRDTGQDVKDYYTAPDDSQIYVEGSMESNAGDTLDACIMNMVTEEIACDTRTVDPSDDVTEFFVDMNYATRASD